VKNEAKKHKIELLRKRRDKLWNEFQHTPRSSFSAITISGSLNAVQQSLDKIEGSRRSKRFYTEITFG
jgi:hypothetical protein